MKNIVVLYAEVKENQELFEEVKDKIKETMLKNRQRKISPSGCAFMLEMQVNPTTKVDRDSIINSLAESLYGKNFLKSSKFRKLMKRNTKRETVVKLCEPKPNSNYKKRR